MSDLTSEDEEVFHATFSGTREERSWILEWLRPFHADLWFTKVLYRVRGGKEANVYCCRAHPSTGLGLIAAKVFRPRMFRAMHNDALYKEGRGLVDGEGKLVLDGRSRRALAKKTPYGKRLDSAAWCQHEVRVLDELARAGADVPRVHASSPNAILMEFVGDETRGAPVLHEVSLERPEAEALLERLLWNVETMLSAWVVHADLSAFNVLYWEGEVTVIDVPQAVDALRHPRAFELFLRDVDHLCRYFVRQGVACDAYGLALDLWRRHVG